MKFESYPGSSYFSLLVTLDSLVLSPGRWIGNVQIASSRNFDQAVISHETQLGGR